MKKILLATAAVGLLAVGAPAATAAAGDTITGGCGFSANSPGGSNPTFTGELDNFSVTQDAQKLPVTASVTCTLYVGSNVVATLDTSDVATMTGNGVQFGAKQITYPDGDIPVLCTTVDFGGGDVRDDCGDATEIEIPPKVVRDLIWQVTSIPDFVLCPILQGLAGTYLEGLLVIDGEGDVYFPAPDKFWDCPPYDPPV